MTDDDFLAARLGSAQPPANDHGDRWHFLPPDGEGATPAYAERFHLVYSVMVPAAWRYEVQHRYQRYGRDPRQLIAAASDIALHLTFGPPPVTALSPSAVIDRVRVPTTASINWLIAVATDRSGRGGCPDGPPRPRRRDGLDHYPEIARRFEQACLRLSGSHASEIRDGDHELLATLRALESPAADQLEELMRRWRWIPGRQNERPTDRADEPWGP